MHIVRQYKCYVNLPKPGNGRCPITEKVEGYRSLSSYFSDIPCQSLLVQIVHINKKAFLRLCFSTGVVWSNVAPICAVMSSGPQHRMKVPIGSCLWSLLAPEVCPEIVWKDVMVPGLNNAEN